MGMPITTTLSSVGTGRPVNLDWMSAKYTSFVVTSTAASYFVEGTLNDLQLSSSPTWFTLSSATLTANSSINLYTGPLAGIRLNSTTSGGTLTLSILQGIGW